MPEIPQRREGKRGRIAKSDAHNLHEALLKLEESVLRFMSEPDVSFTNNTGEQKIRMSKVKIKVSGCFRTELYAHAWCRISSYLDSMKALGYNPHVAIQIALDGIAADMIGPREGESSYHLDTFSDAIAAFRCKSFFALRPCRERNKNPSRKFSQLPFALCFPA